jgi:hypothetical protein
MTKSMRLVVMSGLVMAGAVAIATTLGAAEPDASGWDAKAAAKYLDSRAEWWSTWPNAARDKGTFCISCHTTLPYAIARPALRTTLGESGPSASESKILNNLLTRARDWRDIEPFYPDQTRGIPKTSESRAIESVMNAVVLARRDAGAGRMSDDTRTALGVMWSLQMKTGRQRRVDLAELNYDPWSPRTRRTSAHLWPRLQWDQRRRAMPPRRDPEQPEALRGYFDRQHGTVSC